MDELNLSDASIWAYHEKSLDFGRLKAKGADGATLQRGREGVLQICFYSFPTLSKGFSCSSWILAFLLLFLPSFMFLLHSELEDERSSGRV